MSDEAPPREVPSWSDALTLALPLGLAAQQLATGALALGLICVLLGSAAVSSEPTEWLALLGLLVTGALSFALGLGLLWLSPIARAAAVLLGALAALASLLLGMRGAFDAALALLLVAGLLLAFLRPEVARWFTPEGRAVAAAVPGWRAYVSALVWLQVLELKLRFVTPAFQKMFKEVGIALRPMTEAVLAASSLVSDFPLVFAFAPLFVAAPLLRIPERHARTVTLTANLVGFVIVGSAVGWLVVPLIDLLQKL